MSKSAANQVLRGSIIIVLVGVLAKLASFISEAILAAYLGTNSTSDAYYMVASIQNVIFPMINMGIWKVFLPLYKEHITHGQLQEADTLANKSITFFTTASICIVTLLMLFAEVVVGLVAPGFEGDTKELCATLVRIAAPKYILITAAAVIASMLHCHGKFFGSQIREVASHIPTILAALFLYRSFGIRVMAVALVVGAVFRLLVELPFMDWGYRFRPDFRFRSDEFRYMLRRMPPVFVTEATVQIHGLVDKAMASTLPDGNITCMNYGHKLMSVFSGLLSTAVGTALYPAVIELLTKKKKEELSRLITKIMNIFFVLMVPITLACVLFGSELVKTVFQRGAFDQESTRITAGIFSMYIIGLVFIAINSVLNNLFYGSGDTKTPMFFSIAAMVLNVSLNFLLIGPMGANGLALATSLSSICTFFIRLFLSRKIVNLDRRQLIQTVLKVLCCSAAACFIPRFLFWKITGLNVYLVLIVSALLGVGIYLAGLHLLKVEELRDLKALLLKKRKRASD